MPELPEVETIRRQLEPLVVGKKITSIEVLNPGSFRANSKDLVGKTIVYVGRKGKVLVITSSRGPAKRGRGDLMRLPRLRQLADPRNDQHDLNSENLFIHLKMSGQLEFIDQNRSNSSKKAWPFPKRPGLSKHKHLRVRIGFANGSWLLFHDQRKFGWITSDPAVLPRGIDALDPELTPGKLAEILSSSSRPIKTILLDQSKIAGIGNIYASEILWEAGFSPMAKFRAKGQGPRAKGRKDGKFAKLHAAVREVLADAIDSGGSTMDDGLYQHVSGESGNYWSRRRAYDREGEPCSRCQTPIEKITVGQRSTYFCPACQN